MTSPFTLKFPCDDGISKEVRDKAETLKHEILVDKARSWVEVSLLSLMKSSWQIEAKAGRHEFDGESYLFNVKVQGPELGGGIDVYADNRASAFAAALAVLFQKEIEGD